MLDEFSYIAFDGERRKRTTSPISMKTAIAFIGLYVAFTGHVLPQTNQTGPSGQPTIKTSPVDLVTTSGTVYRKFRIEQEDPAGLTISYAPDGGGLGVAKIPFKELPEELQRRFNYDPQKAAAFDTAQQESARQAVAKLIAEEKQAKETRAKLEAEAEEAEKRAKLEAEAKQNEEHKIKGEETRAKAAATPALNPPVTNNPVPVPARY